MANKKDIETKTVVEAHLYQQQDKLKEAIVAAQKVLAEYIVPDSQLSEEETISKLLGILDNEKLVKLIRNL